ncbi:MAG TPA: hotdog domain-containing protein [Clostridium sp.]|uniref:thioesterase family protein n=1 Tax=Clostridium sp. TaxID=1506 RepID=UPI002F934AA2
MNFNTILKIGESLINEYIVNPEDTADFIGNIGVITLSTPSMVRYIEATATHLVIPNIPKNYRPVGTKINIEHINPTPVNMKVTVNATLIAIEGRKLRYNVEVFNEKCKIGFGTYEQHVINLGDFLNKY